VVNSPVDRQFVDQAHISLKNSQSHLLDIGDAFPNPAQGYINLPFTIPSAGNVSLKIYAVSTGHLVKEINEQYSQGGNHTVRIDLSNFRYDDRGLYFYRLQHNGVEHPTAKQFSVLGL
jgi:hypothetical protein